MTRVRLDEIAIDAGTQIRAAINEQVVTDYAERMTEGVEFPAIVLFHDGNGYYLADGFHRAMAAQRNQFRDIDADVRPGTKADAIWFALGANRANGHRLTDADKKHALRLAVATFPERSMRQLAEQVGCSSTYASRIRDEVQTSLQPVSRVTGADGKTYHASHAARDAAREAAVAMFRQGKGLDEVRAAAGIGRDLAQRLRKEAGAGLDKSKAGVEQRKQAVRDMAGRGFSSRQISAEIGVREDHVAIIAKAEGIAIPADSFVKRTKRLDANRIVAQMVLDAENLCADVNLIEFAELDRSQVAGWLRSLQQSRDQLGGFIRRLMKEKQNGEAA